MNKDSKFRPQQLLPKAEKETGLTVLEALENHFSFQNQEVGGSDSKTYQSKKEKKEHEMEVVTQRCVVCGEPSDRTEWKNKSVVGKDKDAKQYVACDKHPAEQVVEAAKKQYVLDTKVA